MEDGGGAVFTEWKLITKKKNQDSCTERVFICISIFMYDTITNHMNSSTAHAIVGEPFTELIPHNEEHREWKGSQLAELL